MQELKNLEILIEELNSTNSSNAKKEILKKHPECKEILKWTYNPFKIYNITSKNIIKKRDSIDKINIESNTTIYDVLDNLDKRVYTGYEAIAYVQAFIEIHKEHEETIFLIIDRNLKTRADAKLINKVFPKLIPSFDVALAQKYSDYAHKIDFTKEKWFSSRKLDGCRCITIIKNGEVKFYSRKGKEFFTLDKVKEEIIKYFDKIYKDSCLHIVLDGEMCIVNEKGDEDFASIISEIRKKDHIIENPKYKIFDILLYENFINDESAVNNPTLEERIDLLKFFLKEENNSKILDVVNFTEIKDLNHFFELEKEASDKCWEGLIIRKDVPYEGKRTKDMLKVKKFLDEEYTVLNAVMGPIRYIVDGKEIEEEMLSAITIKHKGFNVSVGSGFSMDFRKECYKDPSKIVGKTVTVKYFEETKNKHGEISLRFPTVLHVYEDGRQT